MEVTVVAMVVEAKEAAAAAKVAVVTAEAVVAKVAVVEVTAEVAVAVECTACDPVARDDRWMVPWGTITNSQMSIYQKVQNHH